MPTALGYAERPQLTEDPKEASLLDRFDELQKMAVEVEFQVDRINEILFGPLVKVDAKNGESPQIICLDTSTNRLLHRMHTVYSNLSVVLNKLAE